MEQAVDVKINFMPDLAVAANAYEGVAERVEDLRGGWDEVHSLLEATHLRHFQRLAHRPDNYVKSGALKASLTLHSPPDGVRVSTPNELKFGSRLSYAAGLTMAPGDPFSGQLKKVPPGEGKYAVLVFSATTRELTRHVLLDYVKGGFDRLGEINEGFGRIQYKLGPSG